MHPVIFEIAGFPLRSFGVLVAAGFLLGIWLWNRLMERYGRDPAGDPERASQVAVWVLLGVIGGARLAYVVVESSKYLGADTTPEMLAYLDGGDPRALPAEERVRADDVRPGHDFIHDPVQVLFIWKGGLVMYGGFFGCIVMGMWSTRRAGINPLDALDTGVVAGFVGPAVGRIGCLLVGDDYGSVVPEKYRGLPFPITLTIPDREWLAANPESLFDPALAGQVVWATQPWMSVNALLVAAVGYVALRHRRYLGQAGLWVLMTYSVTRFGIEAFRGDDVRGVWFGGALSTSQLIAIPVAAGAALMLFKNRKRLDPALRAG